MRGDEPAEPTSRQAQDEPLTPYPVAIEDGPNEVIFKALPFSLLSRLATY
jgi:hypothetical protein